MDHGTLKCVKAWWDEINQHGPYIGYYPNARKSCLIVKEQYYEQAKEIFKDDNIMITTEGHRHLGAIIGTDEFKNSYIEKMAKDWIDEIQCLSEIAKTYPHSAYSAFVHGLQNRYTYTMRTIPDLSDHLQPLEDAIRNCFIKTLFNGYICSDSERLLFSLPAKFGGLGIFAPTERSRIEYENSRHITAEMIENVKNQVSNYDSKIEVRQNIVMNHLKNEKTKRYEKTLADIKGQITDPVRFRALESCLEKGASSWLTALPLKDRGFLLDKQSFWDSLYLRYNLSIPRKTNHKYPTAYSHNSFEVPKARSSMHFRLTRRGPSLWNHLLTNEEKDMMHLSSLKMKMKKKLLNSENELSFF